MEKLFETAARGRIALYEGRLDEALDNFTQCFAVSPAAWWFQMEMLRIKKLLRQLPEEKSENRGLSATKIFFAPDYQGNSYQSLLYSQAVSHGASAEFCSGIDVERIVAACHAGRDVLFHQHWLREIYRSAGDETDGYAKVDSYISALKTMRAFGVRVIWTVHNLLDHDLQEWEKAVCRYAIDEMAQVANIIHVHTQSSQNALEDLTGRRLGDKCVVVGHPLYVDLRDQVKAKFPKELERTKLDGKRVTLCLGMIRPYKGVSELLDAYEQVIADKQLENHCLVVAGRMQDERVKQRLISLCTQYPDQIFSVPRVLSEAEMAALYMVADVAVMPYRAILISGSYYLATTFAVPSIVPNIGMFQDTIEHGISGIKYDSSVEGLVEALRGAICMKESQLKAIGENAWRCDSHRTSEWFSDNYFKTVLRPVNLA